MTARPPAEVAVYLMNPAEDIVIFGDSLAEGMMVLPDHPDSRYLGQGEDNQLRAQRFRRVTRLRRTDTGRSFIGEWVDGYQRGQHFGTNQVWIVKRDSLPGGAS